MARKGALYTEKIFSDRLEIRGSRGILISGSYQKQTVGKEGNTIEETPPGSNLTMNVVPIRR
jgi:hypothetical protein